MKRAKAVYAYNADKPSHLTVSLDEVVTVIDDKKSWWLVRNAQGREGKVPSNYMELLSGSEATMEGEPWFHGDIVDRTVAERRLSSLVQTLIGLQAIFVKVMLEDNPSSPEICPSPIVGAPIAAHFLCDGAALTPTPTLSASGMCGQSGQQC